MSVANDEVISFIKFFALNGIASASSKPRNDGGFNEIASVTS